MVIWPREAVLMQCKNYAPLVPLMEGIEPARLLAALAMNESSLGANSGPRHEPAWDVGGKYASDPEQAKLLSLYPYFAACSFGPWQIMFYNCSGYTPTELNTDLSLVTRATISYLSRQIQRWKPSTIQAIGEIWNHGSPVRPPAVASPGVQLYCKDLAGNYIAAETWLETTSVGG